MKIRTEQPKNNKYYIRLANGGYNGAVLGEPTIKGANVLCNCVGYANGRFNEIGAYGKCKYQLVCNAENFIESAKKQGLKINSTPIQGGIMVWQKGKTLGGSDGAGHVAVVEEVYNDGTILTSESGWKAWAFKTVRRSNNNGRWGQNEYYKFRGCIINPAVTDAKVVPAPKLTVDGIGGANTVRAMQKYFGTTQDGVISGQNKTLNKYYPSLKAVQYGSGGSPCIKNLQKWLGVSQDGVLGQATVKAWQKKLGIKATGIFDAASMKVLQKYLNEHDKATYPTTTTKKTTTTTTTTKTNAQKLADKAKELAWAKDTAESKYKYPSGSATSAFKTALSKAYPNRSSWGAAPKVGASCDVFVGTCVRALGIDKNFPRGLSEQMKYTSSAFNRYEYKNVKPSSKMKVGDIVMYTHSNGTHIVIVGDSCYYEANYKKKYGHTNTSSRLKDTFKKVIILRAK